MDSYSVAEEKEMIHYSTKSLYAVNYLTSQLYHMFVHLRRRIPSGDRCGNGGLDLNALLRVTICFWFWQEALQRSRPDFISRSQCRVQELERRKQKRRELAGSVNPKSVDALRQRTGRSARSPPLNGTVPAAILTSLISCTANCLFAAAAAVCHNLSHTQNKEERDFLTTMCHF